MISPRLPALLAIALLFSQGAEAQNFFERLFGITPSRPEPPPITRQAPLGPPTDEPKRTAPPPVQARPVAVRAPSEESVNGRLRIERTARNDLRLKLTLVGRRAAGSVETCSVAFGGEEGAPLVSLGKPEGTARYQLQSPDCTLQLDVLDEAVLVKGPAEICVFPSASCQADPSGLWGPEPSQLLAKARDYEQTRGSSDKAVRENYKVLGQRAGRENIRPIVAEQAAFSSDREMICRSYAREGTHSFCNARYTEARALSLATRLGIGSMAANASGEPRLRRQRNESMDLPATGDITQRPGLDPDE